MRRQFYFLISPAMGHNPARIANLPKFRENHDSATVLALQRCFCNDHAQYCADLFTESSTNLNPRQTNHATYHHTNTVLTAYHYNVMRYSNFTFRAIPSIRIIYVSFFADNPINHLVILVFFFWSKITGHNIYYFIANIIDM